MTSSLSRCDRLLRGRLALSLASLGLLLGCGAFKPTPSATTLLMEVAGAPSVKTIETGGPEVFYHSPANTTDLPHYVFFEGDGAAWSGDGQTPPVDPTPAYSLALEWFVQLGPKAIGRTYIGRECQFVRALNRDQPKRCPPAAWTSARYSQAYIDRITGTLQQLNLDPSRMIFVGHSGGGNVALLVARAVKPRCLVTMASPLDSDYWTKHMGYEPLTQSLNAALFSHELGTTKYMHYVGALDTEVPPASVTGSPLRVRVSTVSRAGHSSGWREVWKNIWVNPCESD
jgi:pimeloyl-ACP methyl ester carboxylesterase